MIPERPKPLQRVISRVLNVSHSALPPRTPRSIPGSACRARHTRPRIPVAQAAPTSPQHTGCTAPPAGHAGPPRLPARRPVAPPAVRSGRAGAVTPAGPTGLSRMSATQFRHACRLCRGGASEGAQGGCACWVLGPPVAPWARRVCRLCEAFGCLRVHRRTRPVPPSSLPPAPVPAASAVRALAGDVHALARPHAGPAGLSCMPVSRRVARIVCRSVMSVGPQDSPCIAVRASLACVAVA